MKLQLVKGATDVTVNVFVLDSSVTTGAGLTGLTFGASSLVASLVRPRTARAAISLASTAVAGGHVDGGFVEIDSANMPGAYRFDLPDAVCSTGVDSVVCMLKGAANMAPVLLEIQLTGQDLNTATPDVNVAQISGDSTAADNAELFFDGTGYAGGTTKLKIDVSDWLTTQMTESYAADGVDPTPAQAFFAIMQTVGEFAVAGTTLTVKKIDKMTTALTFTLSDATNPTSRTRAT